MSPGLSALWIAALAVQIGLSVVAAGFAVARRRQPTSTLAWLLAILFIPVAGALAYFALANPYIARPRRQWKATGRWRADLEREGTGAGELPGSEAARSLMRGVCRATGMRPTHFNHVALSTDNVASAATKEAAIAAATRSVWAEYYIVEGDDAGRRFLDLLTDRAAAGLDVRLLIDAVGSADIDDAAVARLLAAGGRMERFHPVNPFRRRWAVHLRNHRKILVIDGALGFVGSMNVGDNYAGRGRKRTGAWRDTLLRVEGPAVRDLARVFADDWAFMSGEDLSLPAPGPAGGDTAVAIVPSGPDQRENASALAFFGAIGLSLRRCWLATPYFVPDSATLRALTAAARRGVDVRVLLPGKADSMLMTLVNRSYVPSLVEGGVRVFLYEKSMLHAKTLVADGEICLVGSANVDMRSFDLNFEAGALVADAELASAMERSFEADLASSREVRPTSLRATGTLAALAQGAAQVLSPLL